MSDEKRRHLYLPVNESPPPYDLPEEAGPSDATEPTRRSSESALTFHELELDEPQKEHILVRVTRKFQRVGAQVDNLLSQYTNPKIMQYVYGSIIAILIFAGVYFVGGGLPKSRSVSHYSEEAVGSYILDNINPENIKRTLSQLTKAPRLAGTDEDFDSAKMVNVEFDKMGIDRVAIDQYYVYLNWPKPNGRRLQIVSPAGKLFDATLSEVPLSKEGNTAEYQSEAFQGYSKEGNVTAPLVYANFGSEADFKFLLEQGISVIGTIVLLRNRGASFSQGIQVLTAQEHGALGCILYNDPHESEDQDAKMYPDGPRLPKQGIQRTSVALTHIQPGDITTPGYASGHSASRVQLKDSPALVAIPSLSVSWGDAETLLTALEGFGVRMEQYDSWAGSLPNIHYWSGNCTEQHESVWVNLQNMQTASFRTPVWNVMAEIDGIDNDQVLVVGSHRDSFCLSASDGASGTAIMIEVARVFSELVTKYSWRPRRSIIFASWDGSEYNLIGSTEWVEEKLANLQAQTVAYINIGPITGHNLQVACAPSLQGALNKGLDIVRNPNTNETLRTVRGNSAIEGLGLDGDYVAFQDYAGIPSMNLEYHGDSGLKGSCYDSREYVEKFVDPTFESHTTLAKLWATVILELVDEKFISLDISKYSDVVEDYVNILAEKYRDLDFSPMQAAVQVRSRVRQLPY